MLLNADKGSAIIFIHGSISFEQFGMTHIKEWKICCFAGKLQKNLKLQKILKLQKNFQQNYMLNHPSFQLEIVWWQRILIWDFFVSGKWQNLLTRDFMSQKAHSSLYCAHSLQKLTELVVQENGCSTVVLKLSNILMVLLLQRSASFPLNLSSIALRRQYSQRPP